MRRCTVGPPGRLLVARIQSRQPPPALATAVAGQLTQLREAGGKKVEQGKAGKAGKSQSKGDEGGAGQGAGQGSGRLTLLANCHVLRVITEPLPAHEQVARGQTGG